ncbi:MAG: META domain-containing protein [Blastocatellia bacterium]|nr:META domain-containing protein [Blastocatellia bacterium]
MKIKLILLTAIIFIFTALANAQSSLVGGWKIVSITDAKTGNVPLDKAANTITFEKNRFRGTVCNHFSGNYSIAGNKLKNSRMLSTMMACQNIKTEMLVTSVFHKTTYFSLKNNVLMLSDSKSKSP